MTETTDYCDFCDLPLSQCVHGRPPPAPAPARPSVGKAARKVSAPTPKPKKQPTTRATTRTRPVTRRWTPPEVLRPLIVTVLEEAGGELEAEEAFERLEALLEDRMLAGDRERTPEGELRWQYAARRARVALLAEGVMTKSRPGLWQLA